MEARKQTLLASIYLLCGAPNREVEWRLDLEWQRENTQHGFLISHITRKKIRLYHLKYFTKHLRMAANKNTLQISHNWFLETSLLELKNVGHPQRLPIHLSPCLKQGSPPSLLPACFPVIEVHCLSPAPRAGSRTSRLTSRPKKGKPVALKLI